MSAEPGGEGPSVPPNGDGGGPPPEAADRLSDGEKAFGPLHRPKYHYRDGGVPGIKFKGLGQDRDESADAIKNQGSGGLVEEQGEPQAEGKDGLRDAVSKIAEAEKALEASAGFTIEDAVKGLRFDKDGKEEHLTPEQVQIVYEAFFRAAAVRLSPEDRRRELIALGEDIQPVPLHRELHLTTASKAIVEPQK